MPIETCHVYHRLHPAPPERLLRPDLRVAQGYSAVTLNQLKWLTIVLPIAALAVVQACIILILEPRLGVATGHWLAVGIIAAGVVLFSTAVFRVLATMQQKIVRQNEELSALNAVGQAVSGSLDLRDAVASALGNVIEVTRAAAGEITVESETTDEPPLKLSGGKPDDVGLLASLWECVSAVGEPAVGDARIVDLRGVMHPAAQRACAAGFQTYAWVPLRAQNRSFGAMKLLATGGSYLGSEGSERLLAGMGSQIAVAIQAGQLFQDVVRRGRETQALYEIGLKITSLQEIDKILRFIVEQAREAIGSETAALCLAQREGRLALAGHSGPEEAFRRSVSRAAALPEMSLATPEQGRDHHGRPLCHILAAEYRRHRLAAPVQAGTSVIGELCVCSRSPRPFTERHQQLLASLADLAAIAISNARLLESQRHVAVLEERERLAREMHDSLAQVLGYLHLKAQAARRSIARQDTARVEAELEDMASLAHEAYLDVREAILGLRETVPSSLGIVGTLREYLRKFSRQAGIDAHLEVEDGETFHLGPEVEVQLVRVIQEALTNVRKHAEADRARIWMGRRGGAVSISVEDNGRGFDPEAVLGKDGYRFGMRTMRERVEKVGGQFAVESRPGYGTKIHILLPEVEVRSDDTA